MTGKDAPPPKEDDEYLLQCRHPQGHEWEPRARLSEFVLWRCKHCSEQSATSRPH